MTFNPLKTKQRCFYPKYISQFYNDYQQFVLLFFVNQWEMISDKQFEIEGMVGRFQAKKQQTYFPDLKHTSLICVQNQEELSQIYSKICNSAGTQSYLIMYGGKKQGVNIIKINEDDNLIQAEKNFFNEMKQIMTGLFFIGCQTYEIKIDGNIFASLFLKKANCHLESDKLHFVLKDKKAYFFDGPEFYIINRSEIGIMSISIEQLLQNSGRVYKNCLCWYFSKGMFKFTYIFEFANKCEGAQKYINDLYSSLLQDCWKPDQNFQSFIIKFENKKIAIFQFEKNPDQSRIRCEEVQIRRKFVTRRINIPKDREVKNQFKKIFPDVHFEEEPIKSFDSEIPSLMYGLICQKQNAPYQYESYA